MGQAVRHFAAESRMDGILDTWVFLGGVLDQRKQIPPLLVRASVPVVVMIEDDDVEGVGAILKDADGRNWPLGFTEQP